MTNMLMLRKPLKLEFIFFPETLSIIFDLIIFYKRCRQTKTLLFPLKTQKFLLQIVKSLLKTCWKKNKEH